jgi:formylglycine-generating enzyme required for sulfatase activity
MKKIITLPVIIFCIINVSFLGCETEDPDNGTTTTTTVENDPEIERIFNNMVSIPGGTYEMGCSPDDSECEYDELPQHTVTISAFKMSAYEITQGQWEAVMGENPSYFSISGEDCPVEYVTWNDVQDFIEELNSQTGENYRLPTDAEWEYAARAGTTTKWYCGDDSGCVEDIAWYWDDFGSQTQQTHPVGQKTPNAWGMYDMSGNVQEWCQDWYDNIYYSVSPGTDPQGPESGSSRVTRGCSWTHGVGYCRSASRDHSFHSLKSSYLGFRLALPQ